MIQNTTLEQVILVDFGLVKVWDPYDPLTRTAMRGVGTPEYAPPEQYDAGVGHTDPRSDIYSLGATLYHALTGQAPPTATQRMVNPQALKPPTALNPHISTRTEQAVLKALGPQPAQRFQTAHDMATMLSGKLPFAPSPVALSNQRTKVMPRSISGKQPRQSLPVWIWGSGVLGVVLLGGILWILSLANDKMHETVSPTAVPAVTFTATPADVPTSTVSATSTAVSTALPTDTPTQTSLPIAAPTQTPSPTSTSTHTPIPTNTATFTLTPVPTPTKRPTATFTPAPPPTAACASPSQITPPDGALFDTWEKPDLRWSYNCELGLYDHYDVRVWREGNPHYGVNWTKDPVFQLDCQAWFDDYGAGRFCWSIAIVRGQNGVLEKVLVDEGPARCVEIRQGVRPSPTPTSP